MIDYTVRFGLEFDPFLKNSKEILVLSQEYKEGEFRLNVFSQMHGFGVLTGAPGRGKTTLVRNWSTSLNPSLYHVIYSSLSTLTVQEFYRYLALQLGASPAYRKAENFRLIQGEILRLAREKRKTPVIIIDEANYISNAVLNDLKILFNFDMDSKDPAVVLLCGLPQLNNSLRLSSHEPLRQRLVMNYQMEGLSKEEGRQYISRKLEGAGCHSDIFEEAAAEAILNAADGTPRLINRLCSTCLLIAGTKGLSLVTTDIAMQAVGECEPA